VHVDVDPALDEATEQNTIALLTTANGIIDQLKDTSPDVTDLMRELKEPVTKYRREIIEKLLRHKFEAALEDSIPVGMMLYLASMFARCTVADVHFEVAVHGDSIVIYFLCTTVKSLHNLHEMLKSGFMDAVFTDIISWQTASLRTVHVYVTDEEFNARLSVLSSAQGLLFDRRLLILKLKGITSVTSNLP